LGALSGRRPKLQSDGVITEAGNPLSRGNVTGESLPVSKKPERVVIGGAILNGVRAVTIEVKATGEKTYLCR